MASLPRFWFGYNNEASNEGPPVLVLPPAEKRKADVYNRDDNGKKVKGNHKTTGVTRKPETIAEIGGKINLCIQNYRAKTQTWDYKDQLKRYVAELKALGGDLNENQLSKIQGLASTGENSEYAASILRDNGYNVGNAVQQQNAIEENIIPGEEANVPIAGPSGVQARRPEDTPTRPPSEVKRPRYNTTEGSTELATVPPQASTEAAPVLEAPVAAVQVEEAEMSGGGGGATVGVDAAGSLPMQSIGSFMPSRTIEGNDELFRFGGTRMMYSWAYEFFPGNIPAFGYLAANKNDGVVVGHTLPWEWIPFYCTPAEYKMLPHGISDIEIDHVRVRVTPMAKETQFTTNGSNSGVASQEHLCLGHVAVGLNKKWPGPFAQLRAKEGGTVSGAQMSFSSSGLEKVDYQDLSKRFWGNLSNWTANASPYGNPTTTSGTPSVVTNGTARSCMEGNIREIETVSVMMWDVWNKTNQGSCTNSFGVPLIDRFITRFPFMAAVGKPLIDEVYKPKCGIVSRVKHVSPFRYDSYFQAGNCTQTGSYVTKRGYNVPSFNNQDSQLTGTDVNISKNLNMGTKNTIVGSYHAAIERMNIGKQQTGAYSDETLGVQPSITFGMQPIKPIDFSTSLGVPIQARAMWKIDYEIVFRCSRPQEIYHWPYPTNICPSANVANPNALQKSPDAINRHNAFPEYGLYPQSWDTTNTFCPAFEEPPIENKTYTVYGLPIRNAGPNATTGSDYTITDIAGAGYVEPAKMTTDGVVIIAP